MIPYIFYEDPGHGWLAVPVEEARLLKCKFSPYSYQEGDTLYLEEDLDAGIFIQAWKKRNGPTFPYYTDVVNHSSRIRNMKRISREFLDKKLT